MGREENAELGLAYGTSPRQKVDLFFPDATGHTPLALFVTAATGARSTRPPSATCRPALNARGVAVAVAGYDLCPQVTIVQIVNQIRTACLFLWRRFGQRLMVYGHSAGGHLAACMVATDWKQLDPKAPADLVPAGYSISGLFDLKPLVATAMNADFKLNEPAAAQVLAAVVAGARGRVFDAGGRRRGVGRVPAPEPHRRGRLAPARRRARYEAIPGANHFTVLDPLSDPNSAMTARCAALAARCAKVDKVSLSALSV
jgi:arylformamidase